MLAVLAVLPALAPATAQAARATKGRRQPPPGRDPGRPAPLPLPELTGDEAAPAAIPAAPASVRLDALMEERIHARELQVDALRTEAIGLLERLLARPTPGGKRPADGLFKLAELYWEESQRQYLEEMGRYQEALAALREGKSDTPPQEPRLDLRRSIALFEELLRDHQAFARADAVLYLHAFALSEAGRDSEALAQFGRILRDHPGSPFAPDAHFALAENAFAHDDPAEALAHYAAVGAAQGSALSDLALYKSAWCHFKLRRYESAAEAFAAVLTRAKERRAGGGGSRSELIADAGKLEDEALSYLAVVFSEIGGGTEAAAFLTRIGGDDYRDRVLERLAGVFLKQARFDKAIDTTRTLLALYPEHALAPRRRHQIALAYVRLGKEELAIEELRELARLHGPASAWYAGREGDAAAIAGAALAEADLHLVAVHLHQRAQSSKRRPDYELAAATYGAWVEAFAGSAARERVAATRFARGDTLYQLERWGEAAEEWRGAAAADPTGPTAAEAGFAAVQAYERAAAAERPAGGGPKEPTPGELGLAAAAGDFVTLFPSDPRGPKVLFAAGKNLYDRGAWAEAAPALFRLASAGAESELTVPAADLCLDAYARAARWVELEASAVALQERPSVAASPLGPKLPGIAAAARFSSAQALDKAGQTAEAAAAYLAVAERYPEAPSASRSLVNAGRLLAAKGDVEGAVSAYDRAAAGKLATAEVSLAAVAAARLLEGELRFEEAARRYGLAARAGGGDAGFNEALLLEALGDAPGAAAAYRGYAGARPAPKDAAEALLRGGKALVGAGRWAEAEPYLAELARKHPAAPGWLRAEAHLLRGLALGKLGKRKAAEDSFEEAQAAARRDGDPRAPAAAARARFERAELDLPAYEAIRFNGGKGQLKARVAEKAAQLRKLETGYAEVVTLRDTQWALAALCRIGELYEAFARALYDAPLPRGLSRDEEEAYRAALREEAYPIEERGIGAFELGLQKAAELRQVSPWVQRMRERLAALDPSGHPGLKEAFPAPDPVDDLPSAPLIKEAP